MGTDLTPESLEYKDLATLDSSTGNPTGEASDTGVIEALVAVTGVKDAVNDIIVPGAFTRTLRERPKPKACLGHDWNRPIGKTLAIKELMPGDPSLPKTTADGDPWPREAGAVWARFQVNLDSDDGRAAYSSAKFYGPEESTYSIGYRTTKSQHRRGVRHIQDLDLLEYSQVLNPANRLASLQSVKADDDGVDEQDELGNDDIELKARYVKDPEYWGYPAGTPITAGMRPKGDKARALIDSGKKPSATQGSTTAKPEVPGKAPAAPGKAPAGATATPPPPGNAAKPALNTSTDALMSTPKGKLPSLVGGMSDEELRAHRDELAHRADLLGKPGELNTQHRAIVDEISKRDGEQPPDRSTAALWRRDPKIAADGLSETQRAEYDKLNFVAQADYHDQRGRDIGHAEALNHAQADATKPATGTSTDKLVSTPKGKLPALLGGLGKPGVLSAAHQAVADEIAKRGGVGATKTPPGTPYQVVGKKGRTAHVLYNDSTYDVSYTGGVLATVTVTDDQGHDTTARGGSTLLPHGAQGRDRERAVREALAQADASRATRTAQAGATGMTPDEAKTFLDGHYGAWRQGLTAEQDKAMRFYQSPGFALMNGQLRGLGKDQIQADTTFTAADLTRARKASKDLTAAIDTAPPLDEPLTVFRGFSADQFGALTPGAVISDKGFTSTSLTDDAGAVGRATDKATAEIRLPAGTKAAAGSARELVLPPGAQFRVASVEQRPGGTHVVLDHVLPTSQAPDVTAPNPAPKPVDRTATIGPELLDEAAAAKDFALGLTEEPDGTLVVTPEVADRQDRVERLLADASGGSLDLRSQSTGQLTETRKDLSDELALQSVLAQRDATPKATAAQGGMAKPARRPGLAGAAQDHAEALTSGDTAAVARTRARLESSVRRTRASSEVARTIARQVAGGDAASADTLGRLAQDLRAETRQRRNAQARSRRTAKRLERERIQSLIGQIDSELTSRGGRSSAPAGQVSKPDGDLTNLNGSANVPPMPDKTPSQKWWDTMIERDMATLATPGDWVRLVDLRPLLDARGDRATQDTNLRRLSMGRKINIVPESNRKALGPEDEAASIRVGGETNHLVAWVPERPAWADTPMKNPSTLTVGEKTSSQSFGGNNEKQTIQASTDPDGLRIILTRRSGKKVTAAAVAGPAGGLTYRSEKSPEITTASQLDAFIRDELGVGAADIAVQIAKNWGLSAK
jgi:phage head maturation protease